MNRAISAFIVRHSGLTVKFGARTGAITLVQRLGSALNLDIHLYILFLDGASALAVARRLQSHVVLMDVQLSGVSGVSTMKAIPLLKCGGFLISTAITALAIQGDRERLMRQGFAGITPGLSTSTGEYPVAG